MAQKKEKNLKQKLKPFIGEWYDLNDSVTQYVRELLSNGKHPLTMAVLAKEDGGTQEYLQSIGLKLIYERNTINNVQKKRWKIISA